MIVKNEKPLAFNTEATTAGLIRGFIDKYFIWKDYCNICQSTTTTSPVVEVSVTGIPCFHFTDLFRINSCQDRLIAIDCLTEGIHSLNFFKGYAKDKKYIIFSNGDWDKEYYNLPINYELIHSHWFLWEMADIFNSPNRLHYYHDKTYNFDNKKPYSFISTIGYIRPDRDLLVNQLKQLHPRRNFVLKYAGQDLANSSDHLDVMLFRKGKFDPHDLYASGTFLDNPIAEKHYYNLWNSLPMNMYNSANFNLVVETDLDFQNEFFLTEKTIKALMTGMPFVSVSHPLFLSRLHKLGFSTYNTLWDESYDQETDYKTRVNSIIELCDFLCDFDWISNRKELELISLKNRSNFMNLHQVAEKEFKNFEKIILELSK